MNLAVQDFLRKLKAEDPSADSNCGVATQTESESCIAKLRSLVRWIHSSPQRSDYFKTLCKSCGVPRKEVVLFPRLFILFDAAATVTFAKDFFSMHFFSTASGFWDNMGPCHG